MVYHKKILEVDYPRGKAKGYYANFISAKSLKTEFSLFHPFVIRQLPDDIFPQLGEKAAPRGKASGNYSG